MRNGSSATDIVPVSTRDGADGEPRADICCSCLLPAANKKPLGTLPKLCKEKRKWNIDENVVGEEFLAAGTPGGACTWSAVADDSDFVALNAGGAEGSLHNPFALSVLSTVIASEVDDGCKSAYLHL
jgi:hypothetical protein